MKKALCLQTLVFAIAVALGGGATPAKCAEKLTLMLDWFPNIDHLPIYVARDLGLFTKAGIEVEIITPSETADGLKLAAAGEVDMAVSYEPQAIIAASSGVDIRVVGTLIEHPLSTLLFLKDKGIAEPADLVGKTIGYTVPGLMDILLKAFATVNGVQDYHAVNVGFTIIPALVAGKVDAVMGPFKTYETVELAHQGYDAGYFALEKWGIPDYEELIFVCGPAALTAKTEAIHRFTEAVHAAIVYARKDPRGALEVYLRAVPEADAATETDAFQLTLPYYATKTMSDPIAWQKFADFARQHGLIEKQVDTTKLIQIW
jgi:putative hydroxymethylpyrimidine transport system substrate-binding protein